MVRISQIKDPEERLLKLLELYRKDITYIASNLKFIQEELQTKRLSKDD